MITLYFKTGWYETHGTNDNEILLKNDIIAFIRCMKHSFNEQSTTLLRPEYDSGLVRFTVRVEYTFYHNNFKND